MPARVAGEVVGKTGSKTGRGNGRSALAGDRVRMLARVLCEGTGQAPVRRANVAGACAGVRPRQARARLGLTETHPRNRRFRFTFYIPYFPNRQPPCVGY